VYNLRPEFTYKKEKKIFLIPVYKETQMGSIAKSYMRKGFLKYEEMHEYLYVRSPLVIYDFETDPFLISLYKRKILFSFL
jgi:hypothetical protein